MAVVDTLAELYERPGRCWRVGDVFQARSQSPAISFGFKRTIFENTFKSR
jgi:hypothetical protein